MRRMIASIQLPDDIFPITVGSDVLSPFGRFIVDAIRERSDSYIQPTALAAAPSSAGAGVGVDSSSSAGAGGGSGVGRRHPSASSAIYSGRLADWTLATGRPALGHFARGSLTVDTEIFCHDCEQVNNDSVSSLIASLRI